MRSRAVITGAVLGCALASGGWFVQRGLRGETPDAYASARLLDEVMAHIERDYVDTVATDSLYEKATVGMLRELGDPHTVLLSPKRLASLEETTSGRYAGIGARIDVRDNYVTIVSPLPGSPASEAGLQPGDKILSIDGKDAEGLTAEEAMKQLRGDPGSKVQIVIGRAGVEAKLPFSLTRREIHVAVVEHAQMLRDGVGYVDLTTFSEDAAAELARAVDSLRKQGMKSLVFDLREDPGGLLDQGVAVSDLFLDPGQPIVSMKGRTPDADREYKDRARQPWPQLPIVVLVDSGTASAAEIVSGALQDHDRALIVGTTSYGKGSAQSLFPTVEGGALKLTTALWYTPSGRSINRPHQSEEDESSTDDRVSPDTGDVKRPTYKTDAGRTVLGGGGITPDVIVAEERDSAATSLEHALGKQIPQFRDVLVDYALSFKGTGRITSPDFTVTPEMRNELYTRLQQRGVKLDRTDYDKAATLVDRMIGNQVAQYLFGERAAYSRQLRDDRTVAQAIQLAAGARNPKELLQRGDSAAKKTPPRR